MMKCIIIEDERPAQNLLMSYVNRTPFLQCIGVFESPMDISPIQLKEVSLIFLDIHLPELDGLSFLKSIPNPPKVIISTAYSEYAVEAFDIEVVDYLLKPFSFERYFKAVGRVGNSQEFQNRKPKKNIFIYADKTHYNIQLEDILFLKAEVDYVHIVTEYQKYLVLDSLRNWMTILEPLYFIQVHRSYIVSINKIVKIVGNQIYIIDQILPIGKTYKEGLLDRIGQ